MISNDPRPLICHVVYRFDVGGLENGLVNLLNRLPATAWRHQVLALTQVVDSFRRRVERDDVEYVALDKRPGHLIRLFPELRRRFREQRPAIVHTRNLAALEVTAPAWSAGVPVRIHGEHGRDARDPDGSSRRYRVVRRAYSPFVTRYVALSHDLERYLTERVGIAPARVIRICNGVDTERFRPRRPDDVRPDGCPFDPARHWLVGTVGRMDPIKDPLNLVHAFIAALQLVPRAEQRMRLVLVGDGELRSEVERAIDSAGVRSLVWIAGERPDVASLLRWFDCFVLPSRGEGISNTLLEAMASGVAIVATSVGGNPELVIDRATGALVPAADSAALARAMVAAYTDPAQARRHAHAGRERALRCYSLRGMVDRYHELYTAALVGSGAAAHRTLASPARSA